MASGSDARAFFRLAWRHRRAYGLGILALAAVDALDLAVPVIVATVVDSLVPRVEPATGIQGWLVRLTGADITRLVVLLVAAVGVQAILRYLWRVGFFFTSFRIAHELRTELYAKLTRLAPSYYQSQASGELVSIAASDVESVRMFLGGGLLIFFDACFYLVFAPLLLASYSGLLVLVVLAGLPILPLLTRRLVRTVHDRAHLVQDELANVSALGHECFAGAAVLRSFAREEIVTERFAQASRTYRDRNLDLWRAQRWLAPLLIAVVAIEELLLAWVGGHEVISGAMSPGQLVGAFFLLVMLTWPMEGLGWVLALYERGRASAHRIATVMDAEETIQDGRGGVQVTRGAISFEGVGLTYPGQSRPALTDIDLEIPAGATVAIVGPVGSGKSSLGRLIVRLWDAGCGRVRVDGHDVREFKLAELRGAIGYAPQESFLFSRTVAENIAFARPEATRAEIEEAARDAGLASDIAAMPQGLETLIGERGIMLSGGQRQRVALARAILGQPRLLVLDDCFSSVDAGTEALIRQRFAELRQRHTLVLVTSRLWVAASADTIVVLSGGRIVERGTHAELVARGGWYSSTYRAEQRRVAGGRGVPA